MLYFVEYDYFRLILSKKGLLCMTFKSIASFWVTASLLVAPLSATQLHTYASSQTPTYLSTSSTLTSTANFCPVDNPFHQIVNKNIALAADFVPDALVVPQVPFSFAGTHEKSYLNATAAEALEALFDGATKDGIVLAAVSGYRSYDRQAQLYNNYVARDGQALADTYSARPGTSEHQLGLAMDVSAPSVGYRLTADLGTTKEGIWLAQNAHHYGFIIRYLKGKESITGYMYEPWHLRYVGETLAHEVYASGLTLEEMEHCCEPAPVHPPLHHITHTGFLSFTFNSIAMLLRP